MRYHDIAKKITSKSRPLDENVRAGQKIWGDPDYVVVSERLEVEESRLEPSP